MADGPLRRVAATAFSSWVAAPADGLADPFDRAVRAAVSLVRCRFPEPGHGAVS